MKEPKRLLSHGATDFERQLLRAVAGERPSSLLRSRMQRGLGLVGPLAWASNVKAMFGTITSRVAVSVTVVGVVVASGFAAVRWFPSSTDDEALEPPPSRESQPAPGGPAGSVSAGSVSAGSVEAPVTAAPLGPTPRAAAPGDVSRSEAATGEPPSVDDDGQLREEIALLDTARAAIQRADRESARATLSAYRERFPNGVLRREARVLWQRTDAKFKRGAASDE